MALDPAQRAWLNELSAVLGDTDAPDGGVGAGDAEARARNQTTVALLNATGSSLRLIGSRLKFATARFVPAAPAVIPPQTKVQFQVVEPTVGANGGAGSVTYHIERRRHDVDVTFTWELATADVTFRGDGPFSTASEAEQDSETGNRYLLLVKDTGPPDKLEVRIDVTNESGFVMNLVSATFEDPAHTEFRDPPAASIKNHLWTVMRAQALDDEHPDAAGNVVYRIEKPGQPHLARMTWRKGAKPTGRMEPNDGQFAIESATLADAFTHRVVQRNGPPPPEPRPMKVTIVNDASFAMKRDLLLLDSPKARFKSEPDETIEGGRRTTFEVEAPDPEFPNASGFVAYAVSIAAAGGEATETVISMDWRSEPPPSFAKVVPPVEGVDVAVSGDFTDVVFTVTGPPLDFNPPGRSKQPTLRLGDQSADGWVEYLQEALNHHINAGLTVDGDFGQQTLTAVKAFQTEHQDEGVLVDGIVGDQTWSFLREGAPESPKTDGRQPHTYVEKGDEARWVREQNVCRFDGARDALVMQAVSVGNVDQLQGRRVRIRIVNPQGVQKIVERPLGPGVPSSTTGQGSEHEVVVERFSTLFDDRAPAGQPPPGSYEVSAFFEADLGGDEFTESVLIP